MDPQQKLSPPFNTTMDSEQKLSPPFNRTMDSQQKLSPPFNTTMDSQQKLSPPFNTTMDSQQKLSLPFNTTMDSQQKLSPPFNTTMDSQQKLSPPFNTTMDSQQKPSLNKSSESKVSRKYVPDDLAFYVLSKLPIKSLKRFGCVRRSWSILFDNSDFMTVFRNHFISHNNTDDDYHTFLLIYQPDPAGRNLMNLPEFHLLDSRITLNLPPPCPPDEHINLSVLGNTSVKGVFCIGKDITGQDSNMVRYVLWNPSTEEFFVIPLSLDDLVPQHLDVFHNFHGFGYDQVRDDFKVIQYVSFFTSGPINYQSFFEIYSLRNNSWKILQVDDMPVCFVGHTFNGDELYLDGACHWLAKVTFHSTVVLMSFKLSDELFFTTPIEEISEYDYGHLAVLNGSIAYIKEHGNDNSFHVSILGELGVKESWIKLFICVPMPSIDWPPIGFGKKGYIFFRKKDDELAYVDLSTQIIVELGVKGKENSCRIGFYKESLLSIQRSSN